MSQIAFSPPPAVTVLCNLCSADAGPFPSPMQAAAAVLDLGWFNHGVKVSICPACLAYYRTVFQNPSIPRLAQLLQSEGEKVVEMPSRNLMVLERCIGAQRAVSAAMPSELAFQFHLLAREIIDYIDPADSTEEKVVSLALMLRGKFNASS